MECTMSSVLALGCILVGLGFLLRKYMDGGVYEGTETMAGKTVVITGANTGVGKETTRGLATRGARVIMGCRDMEKGNKACQEIVSQTKNKNIEVRKLDLASFASVQAFASSVLETESKIDVLINNAGVMMCPDRLLTEDGFELQFGVNHLEATKLMRPLRGAPFMVRGAPFMAKGLNEIPHRNRMKVRMNGTSGHFLLTNLLLDRLKASTPSRIVNVSSIAHSMGPINLNDLNSEKSYSRYGAYTQSKIANVLHALELSSRLKGTGVTANSLHPGSVDTDLRRHFGWYTTSLGRALVYPLIFFFDKSPWQGAQTSLRLAIDPALENVTGKYFSDCKEKLAAPQARDETSAKTLWEFSEIATKKND